MNKKKKKEEWKEEKGKLKGKRKGVFEKEGVNWRERKGGGEVGKRI